MYNLIKSVFSGALPLKKHLPDEQGESTRRGEPTKLKILSAAISACIPAARVFNCKTQFYNWILYSNVIFVISVGLFTRGMMCLSVERPADTMSVELSNSNAPSAYFGKKPEFAP